MDDVPFSSFRRRPESRVFTGSGKLDSGFHRSDGSKSNLLKIRLAAFFVFSFVTICFSFAFTDSFIREYQEKIAVKPVGERIALWAEKFVGVPYDPDPLGAYVSEQSVVADDRVDCMYLTFRSVELAMSRSPEEAVNIALDKRFPGKGILEGRTVKNYEDRFQYGEDMLESGKWGEEITGDFAPLTSIEGARGRTRVALIAKKDLRRVIGKRGTNLFRDGDLIYFIKSPGKRVVDEIVGHMGIIKLEGKDIYLIHASGRKEKGCSGSSKNNGCGGGEVKKILFSDYLDSMPFAGVRVGRFQ